SRSPEEAISVAGTSSSTVPVEINDASRICPSSPSSSPSALYSSSSSAFSSASATMPFLGLVSRFDESSFSSPSS
ncbi:hypothetical protein M569_12078, partial [Genlisea aurea]